MAKTATVLPKKEQDLINSIDAIKEKAEKAKRELTDAEKSQLKALREQLAQERFVRIANMRVPRTIAAINGIGNLSGAGYKCNTAQVDAIVKALKDAVDDVSKKLSGTKQDVAGFKLPG